jgi:hypothetical protein
MQNSISIELLITTHRQTKREREREREIYRRLHFKLFSKEQIYSNFNSFKTKLGLTGEKTPNFSSIQL